LTGRKLRPPGIGRETTNAIPLRALIIIINAQC